MDVIDELDKTIGDMDSDGTRLSDLDQQRLYYRWILNHHSLGSDKKFNAVEGGSTRRLNPKHRRNRCQSELQRPVQRHMQTRSKLHPPRMTTGIRLMPVVIRLPPSTT
eukprot:COSAG02_NODE_7557_length_2961_cov_9.324948_3_plen_108_part_00